MKAMMIGNIASSIAADIAERLGEAVEEDALKGVVKEVLPEYGIVVEAEIDELRNNPQLVGLLEYDCTIEVVKESENAD